MPACTVRQIRMQSGQVIMRRTSQNAHANSNIDLHACRHAGHALAQCHAGPALAQCHASQSRMQSAQVLTARRMMALSFSCRLEDSWKRWYTCKM